MNAQAVAGICSQMSEGHIRDCYNIGKIIWTNGGESRRDASILGIAFGKEVFVKNCYAEDNLNIVCRLVLGPAISENIHAFIELEGEDKDLLAEKLGNNYKKNSSSEINQGYPILFWQ